MRRARAAEPHADLALPEEPRRAAPEPETARRATAVMLTRAPAGPWTVTGRPVRSAAASRVRAATILTAGLRRAGGTTWSAGRDMCGARDVRRPPVGERAPARTSRSA